MEGFRIASAWVEVTADTSKADAKVDALLTKLGAISGKEYKAKVGVDASGAAAVTKLATQLGTVGKITETARVKADTSGSIAALARVTAAGTRLRGVIAGLGGMKIPLFAGLTTITGLHLLVDGVIEFAAVVGPAIAATLAWGAAAAPTFQDIYHHLSAVNTVVQATGQNLAPMTGAFQRAAAAVKPSVYQLFGDAVAIATNKAGLFSRLALGTGHVIDQLAARFTVAITSGQGFSGWLRNAVPDVAKLGTLIGNLGGAVGNVMHVLPGYAGMLLSVAVAGSRVLEWATRVAQPVIGAGLAMHGAFLYIGLGATLMAKAVVPALAGIGNLALRLGSATGFLAGFGGAGARAAGALRSFGVYAAGASALPWGWIAVAAAGLGFLAYKLITAKDATGQWLASMQATLAAQPAVRGMTLAMADQASVVFRLALASKAVTVAQSAQIGANRVLQARYLDMGNATTQLTAGQQKLAGQTALYGQRLNDLARIYGSTKTAQGLLTASGITFGQMTDKNSYQFALLKQQVASTALAYAQMGQTGGVLGADMAFLTRQTDGTFLAMTKLNQAADAWIGLSSGLMGAQLSVDQAMATMKTDVAAAGASFRGVNAASLTLRADFNNTLVPAVQQVIDGMRQAHASAHNLAAVVATDLSPAVKAGALNVQGMRDMIYTMAREAGFQGTDSIRSLSAWFDRNAGSVQKATDKVSNYSGGLAKVPRNVNTHFSSNVNSVWNSARNYAAFLGGLNGMTVSTYINQISLPGQIHRAAGGVIPGYAPGRDTVAAMLSPGEGILVPEAVRGLGGARAIDAINRRYAGARISRGNKAGAFAAAVGAVSAAGAAAGPVTVIQNFYGQHPSAEEKAEMRRDLALALGGG